MIPSYVRIARIAQVYSSLESLLQFSKRHKIFMGIKLRASGYDCEKTVTELKPCHQHWYTSNSSISYSSMLITLIWAPHNSLAGPLTFLGPDCYDHPSAKTPLAVVSEKILFERSICKFNDLALKYFPKYSQLEIEDLINF